MYWLSMLLGNLESRLADGASKIASIDTTQRTSKLVGLIQHINALDGEFTAAVTLDLGEERLGT